MTTPTTETRNLLISAITYCGQPAVVACDMNCAKAWGINSRPRVQLSDDEDDYAYLADAELPDAPIDPGTYEGECAKPRYPTTLHNKWCVRECERSAMSGPGAKLESSSVPDFTSRVFNIPRPRPEPS